VAAERVHALLLWIMDVLLVAEAVIHLGEGGLTIGTNTVSVVSA